MQALKVVALVVTILSGIAAWLVVPDLRCLFGMHMPAGQCRDSEGDSRHPPTSPAPRVDTVVINTLVPVPPPVPDPPQPKHEVPTSEALPIQMIRLLTVVDLEGKSDWELDIMRNEIYARYGRGFSRLDLHRYFSQFSWYRPIYSPQDFDNHHQNRLTEIQRANAELILRYQSFVR